MHLLLCLQPLHLFHLEWQQLVELKEFSVFLPITSEHILQMELDDVLHQGDVCAVDDINDFPSLEAKRSELSFGRNSTGTSRCRIRLWAGSFREIDEAFQSCLHCTQPAAERRCRWGLASPSRGLGAGWLHRVRKILCKHPELKNCKQKKYPERNFNARITYQRGPCAAEACPGPHRCWF